MLSRKVLKEEERKKEDEEEGDEGEGGGGRGGMIESRKALKEEDLFHGFISQF